jgi:ceramide glucosyltransferase
VAKHELLVISDADVWIEPDLLAQAVHQLGETKAALISCPYALVNAANPAMHLEAMAANADFWSQALQAQTLKPLDFALGAVMVTSRTSIRQIGGLETLLDLLADDYQLGNRIARRGGRLRLCTLPVECRSSPVGWLAVWKHQLRWARTIRVCQPVPYFFSILSNATLWPLLFAIFGPSACPSVSFGTTIPASGVHISVSLAWTGIFLLSAISLRVLAAGWLPQKLTRRTDHWPWVWLAPFYDLLRTIVWVLAFTGKTVIWRGQRFQVKPGGRLVSS